MSITDARLPSFLKRGGPYFALGVSVVLLITSLWLPPFSLGHRLFGWGMPLIRGQEGGTIVNPIGAYLSVSPEAMEGNARMLIEAVDGTGAPGVALSASLAQTPDLIVRLAPQSPEVAALEALPSSATIYSPMYQLQIRGRMPSSITVGLPIPYEIAFLGRLDLYAWDGQAWQWVPSRPSADGLVLEATLEEIPRLLAMGVAKDTLPSIGLTVSPSEAASLPAGTTVTYLSIEGLTLGDGNTLNGSVKSLGNIPLSAKTLLRVSNVQDGIIRSDLIDNLLIDPQARAQHIQEILAKIAEGGYAGVEIAYQGVDPALTPEMNALVGDMAKALHEAGYLLAVRVEPPQAEGDDWNTGAYDWRYLGQVADIIRLPVMVDPGAYEPGGEMDRLLAWATGKIPRQKIQLALSTYCYDVANGEPQKITYNQALALASQGITVKGPVPVLMPGQTLRFEKDGNPDTALQTDPASQVTWFRYQDSQGQEHTVWLETGASVARKLQYVHAYALGGASLEDALVPENDQAIAGLVQTFQEPLIAPEPEFAMLWRVETEDGTVIRQAVTSLDDPEFAWVAPERPGHYAVKAAISDDGGQTERGIVTELEVQVPSPTPTNTPTPTPTSTPTPLPTATPTPAPTATPRAETATAASSSVAAPPPRTSTGFGYGIQAHIYGNDAQIYSLITGMGFNWVKQQVEWKRVEPGFKGNYQWGDLDRIVNGAHAAGLKILLSVVKAPEWARGPGADFSVDGPPRNPQDFADFMAALAARYKGKVQAYEVWNEQNLHYEWGNEPLSASRYVELLAAVYRAIKAVDPSAIVVSGAPTPTGWNDGVIAIDDRLYLEQMYQAGLARYCDAVGVHPSGYNNPPDADWRTWHDPSAPGAKGHPSFFFRGTMEGYRNIMVKYGDSGKKLWPTEFGWSTFEGLGTSAPRGYEYANDNTEAEQAQFLVQAMQMMRNWGWVGPAFIWNLNFAPVTGPADEKAGFGIIRHDWSPRPAYYALRDMPK